MHLDAYRKDPKGRHQTGDTGKMHKGIRKEMSLMVHDLIRYKENFFMCPFSL